MSRGADAIEPSYIYLGLDAHSKELLQQVCNFPPRIELAPLDKGLSGSIVLMGRWWVSDVPSKFHVFKIGNPGKLLREYDAIRKYAAPLLDNFPHVEYAVSKDGQRAILSQEFLGTSDGSVRSLRRFIEEADSEEQVVAILDRLYSERILAWRIDTPQTRVGRIQDELLPWIQKGDLDAAIRDIGEAALEESLLVNYGIALRTLRDLIGSVVRSRVVVQVGPVHGDLHAQNVILGDKDRLSLIDFGWTDVRWRAIDYLWLECSLKYVVSSPYARLEDLDVMDALIDDSWDNDAEINTAALDGRMYAASLKKIAAGVAAIRRRARSRVAALSLNDYRKGIITMSCALTSVPKLNRTYLIHSIARNALALGDDLLDEGPYHRLYNPSALLWPAKAGRMVEKAVVHQTVPGRALDVGCGDGKNLVFLESKGWTVTGIDINSVAVAGVEKRARQHFGDGYELRSRIARADARNYDYPSDAFDLVVAYGLYHCLDDAAVAEVHRGITNSLRSGGYLAFAAFNDTLPVPQGHGTDDLVLRDSEHIFELSRNDFEVVEREIGLIEESHPGVIERHRHGLTWALLRKR